MEGTMQKVGKFLIPGPRILIVDSSDENREVLRTALERRGMQILEAQRPAQGLRLIERHQPDLVLVDLEGAPSSAEELATLREQPAPLLILGTTRLPGESNEGNLFVRKPYHYAPLIRKIEALLAKAA